MSDHTKPNPRMDWQVGPGVREPELDVDTVRAQCELAIAKNMHVGRWVPVLIAEIDRLQAKTGRQITDEEADALLKRVGEISLELHNERLKVAQLKQAKPGWQPIETAPRDGTPVDLWSTSRGRLINCVFSRAQKPPGWFWIDDWETGPVKHTQRVMDATHWMYPPEPPS
jgi:hypothetical protein